VSYNGSGTFNINSSGQPVVTGTVITSTAFNALTADLGTGLTTALTKDGQTTPTANIKLGAFKLVNVGNATTAGDAVTWGGPASHTTLTLTTALTPANGGTGTATAFTTGSVVFAAASGVYTQNNANLFWDNTNNRLGVGTASPASKLAVGGNPPTAGAIAAVGASGGISLALSDNVNSSFYVKHPSGGVSMIGTDASGQLALAANGFTEVVRITNSGTVGIGTTAPVYQLQLSTDSAAKPSTNTWTIASDARIKTETGEYTKGLDAVCALRPITYEYNGAAGFLVDGKENISIIAQEAMVPFPECVGTFKAKLNLDDEQETELLAWNGHALTFALVNSVKELKAQNDALTARITALEAK